MTAILVPALSAKLFYNIAVIFISLERFKKIYFELHFSFFINHISSQNRSNVNMDDLHLNGFIILQRHGSKRKLKAQRFLQHVTGNASVGYRMEVVNEK